MPTKNELNTPNRLGGVCGYTDGHTYTHRHTEKLRELEYRMPCKKMRLYGPVAK